LSSLARCCHESRVVDGSGGLQADGDDVWAPVRDDDNDWLQVGKDRNYPDGPRTCQTHMDLYGSGPNWGHQKRDGGGLKVRLR